MLGDQAGQQLPVLVKLAQHGVQPRQSLGERGHRGEHAEVARQQCLPALFQQRDACRRSRHGQPALQPGYVPALGRGREREGRLGLGQLVIDGEERGEPRAVQCQRRVDLIHEEHGIVPLAGVGDHRQVGGRPHVAGRVVRAAQQVGGRARLAQRRLDRRRVQVVSAGPVPGQRRVDDPPPVEAEPEPERWVDGGVDDDP